MSETVTSQPREASVENKQPNFGSIIASIAGQLGQEYYPTGDRAVLKRQDPEQPTAGATAATLRLLLNAGAGKNEITRRLDRWTLLIHAMALLSGPNRSPHDRDAPAGRVLFANNYSEARLLRLLEARDSTFDALLSRLARFLKGRGAVIDWVGLAPLVLADPNGGAAEAARLTLMRQYIGAERAAERELNKASVHEEPA